MQGKEININDVREKYRRGNWLLFSRDSVCLQELIQLICLQKHRTIVMWIFECVEQPVALLKSHYAEERRPEEAIHLCKLWAEGKVKMPIAKKALLQVHTMAKELKDPVEITLCHAVGQACATVHVETHAVGFVFYELTAIVQKMGIDDCEYALENKIEKYLSSLKSWQDRIDTRTYQWADFLADDSGVNKERQLWEKRLKE